MYYLRGFVPWIAFAAVPAWQWGAPIALILGILLLIQDIRVGNALDSLMLEISTILYFVAVGALALSDSESPLREYDGALSMAWLAVTAWSSLAVRRPFTTGIAKRQAPPEVWDTPVFARINVVITAVWATFFTLSAAGVVIAVVTGLGVGGHIAVEVAGFVIPAVFTARYPKRVETRLARQGYVLPAA
jgi:hypothetical protein